MNEKVLTAMLTRHWGSHRTGSCPAPGCSEQETLEHILVFCPYYNDMRFRLETFENLKVIQILHRVLGHNLERHNPETHNPEGHNPERHNPEDP